MPDTVAAASLAVGFAAFQRYCAQEGIAPSISAILLGYACLDVVIPLCYYLEMKITKSDGLGNSGKEDIIPLASSDQNDIDSLQSADTRKDSMQTAFRCARLAASQYIGLYGLISTLRSVSVLTALASVAIGFGIRSTAASFPTAEKKGFYTRLLFLAASSLFLLLGLKNSHDHPVITRGSQSLAVDTLIGTTGGTLLYGPRPDQSLSALTKTFWTGTSIWRLVLAVFVTLSLLPSEDTTARLYVVVTQFPTYYVAGFAHIVVLYALVDLHSRWSTHGLLSLLASETILSIGFTWTTMQTSKLTALELCTYTASLITSLFSYFHHTDQTDAVLAYRSLNHATQKNAGLSTPEDVETNGTFKRRYTICLYLSCGMLILGYGLSSSTIKRRVHFLVPTESVDPETCWVLSTHLQYGYIPILVNFGTIWETYALGAAGKIDGVGRYVNEKTGPNDLILYVDRDAIAQNPLKDAIRSYDKLQDPIIIAGGSTYWPDEPDVYWKAEMRKNPMWTDAPLDDEARNQMELLPRWANSGGMIGKGDALSRLFTRQMQEARNDGLSNWRMKQTQWGWDQNLLSYLHWEGTYGMELDYNSDIFYTAHKGEKFDLVPQNSSQFMNSVAKISRDGHVPGFCHWNGWTKDFLRDMTKAAREAPGYVERFTNEIIGFPNGSTITYGNLCSNVMHLE